MGLRPGETAKDLEALNGVPSLLGTILVTTSSLSNGTTGTPFNNTTPYLTGKVLLLQPDAACFVMFGSTSATALVTSVKLAADEKFYVMMGRDTGFVAAITATGTANLRVYEMT